MSEATTIRRNRLPSNPRTRWITKRVEQFRGMHSDRDAEAVIPGGQLRTVLSRRTHINE